MFTLFLKRIRNINRRAAMVAVLSLFCLLGIATAETHLLATYENSASGRQTSPVEGVINPLYLDLNISGDTPGTFKTNIHHNNTNNVVGGDWAQAVVRQNEDGSTSTIGTLKGTFNGGTISLRDDGSIASVNRAALTVEGGTGAYSALTSGSGTLNGTFDNSAERLFTGTLSLSF